MNEKKIILGIETSCDETAVSIIEEDKNGKIKIYPKKLSLLFFILLSKQMTLKLMESQHRF